MNQHNIVEITFQTQSVDLSKIFLFVNLGKHNIRSPCFFNPRGELQKWHQKITHEAYGAQNMKLYLKLIWIEFMPSFLLMCLLESPRKFLALCCSHKLWLQALFDFFLKNFFDKGFKKLKFKGKKGYRQEKRHTR